jgi:hypothetical protein
LDQAGNIYGTIATGSVAPGGPPGSYGQVYRISASGTERVLYSFTGGTDGNDPMTPVTLDGRPSVRRGQRDLVNPGHRGRGVTYQPMRSIISPVSRCEASFFEAWILPR